MAKKPIDVIEEARLDEEEEMRDTFIRRGDERTDLTREKEEFIGSFYDYEHEYSDGN